MVSLANKLFFLVALIVTTDAMAQDNASQAYYRAYNICSPAAHYLTRQACNYGVIFEKFYTDCMTKIGFGGESDASTTNYYEGYMKAYNICYSSAEKKSQTSCNYNQSYQKHYNRCMEKYNFDKHGEKLNPNADDSENGKQEGFQFNF